MRNAHRFMFGMMANNVFVKIRKRTALTVAAWFISLLAANPVSAQTTYSLQQLKDSALSHNLSMRKARYDIDAAREQRKEAFTKYFPNVTGTGVWFNANKE